MGDRPPFALLRRWAPGLAEALRASGVSRVHIEKDWDDQGQGLGFLASCGAQIGELSVAAEHLRDLSVVMALPRLDYLSVQCPLDSVDFARLPSLRTCLLGHPATLGNVTASRTLRTLGLFRLRIRSLAPLEDLLTLRELYLSELRSLDTLAGIGSLPLEKIELVYLPRLGSISPLDRLALRSVEITGCGRIGDLDRLGQVPSLERLHVVSGPDLPSLAFVKGLARLESLVIENTNVTGSSSLHALTDLKRLRYLALFGGRKRLKMLTEVERLGELRSLEHLRLCGGPDLESLDFLRGLDKLRSFKLWGATVQDGDMTPILDLPALEEVEAVYPYRRHYSHTLDQLNAVLQARRGPQATGVGQAALAAPSGDVSSGPGTIDALPSAPGFIPEGRAAAASVSQQEVDADRRWVELVAASGSEAKLFRALERAAQAAVDEKALTGEFEVDVRVAGHQVTIRGRVVGGKATVEEVRPLP